MFAAGQHFRHMDGGFYRFIAEARHSEDLSPMIVYQHLWPFDPGVWVRPAGEWAGRFTPVEENVVIRGMQGDRTAAQAAVEIARNTRRAG
ncbi:DUF1653 domain-containing protein [Andreprevotia sp. IGB-42]|uniref:DUF1653 domain-containing protein n=1 Tax=Andreprevotia sp. IGB-42 TaxID=2497473 RepID=UPI00135954D2|nr:DUF1653 domain-containing protein [Andreprevotia sp. IGB-42]